jgi:hypothetical protein
MRRHIFQIGIVLLFCGADVVAQQRSSPRTPLGTQVPRPDLPERGQAPKPQPAPVESASATVQRAANAHGGPNFRNVTDSVADGTLTRYGLQNPHEQFAVTVWRKGNLVQRSVRSSNGERHQGTDGKQTWDAFEGFVTAAQGPTLEFLETQTVRALPNLFEYQARGSRLRDDGMRGPDRVLTIEEANSRTTTYVIEGGRSFVTRLEVVSGQVPDMLGRRMSIVESYVFSDFRTVQGVPTPFKVEHFTNDLKVEELRFTVIRYNTGLAADMFHP